MKVFCLVITHTYDSKVLNPRIPIISNDVRKVQEVLKDFVNTVKDVFKEEIKNGRWIIEANEDGWFEIYEAGRYSENHILALIYDRNLEELNWSD